MDERLSPFEGQEGSQVGAAHALADDDWLFPTYRSNAMQLARGRPPADILRFRRGLSGFEPEAAAGDSADGTGHDGRRGTTFTAATPIATQLPRRRRGDGGDAPRRGPRGLCVPRRRRHLGGDFHEAMNFAGVFSAPVVFFCENNHWAISLPEERQTRSETIAQKASAYGFDGVRVDGNDPLAVYEVVAESRERARSGDPVLVESLTYRKGAHSTSDDPDRYRGDVDLPEWRTADPLERTAEYLREAGAIDEAFVDDARESANAELDEAVAAAESTAEPDPEAAFDYAYAELPPRVVAQRREVVERGRSGQD
ncbi:thiamine pyrophosphate-dependent enzyme [Halosimplex aquaticum]